MSENEKVKAYVDEIPEELRRAIDSFSEELSLAVFLVLYKYGEMSFSEIKGELGVDSRVLHNQIKRLQKSSLVTEYNCNMYNITEFGEKIIKSLMSAVKVE
jgi:predicted transcriptional regulator